MGLESWLGQRDQPLSGDVGGGFDEGESSGGYAYRVALMAYSLCFPRSLSCPRLYMLVFMLKLTNSEL